MSVHCMVREQVQAAGALLSTSSPMKDREMSRFTVNLNGRYASRRDSSLVDSTDSRVEVVEKVRFHGPSSLPTPVAPSLLDSPS